MKLGVSHQRNEHLNKENLRYLKAMGVDSIEARIPSAEATYERIVEVKNMVEDAGIGLHEIMLSDKYSSADICLNLPGRAETMKLYRRFITDLGRAGIHHTTYAWLTLGAFETMKSDNRGCPVRGFRLKDALALPNAFERTYSDEEMWDNYEAFIKEILPVAEDADVRLQLHPNDPPVSHLGIAKIFRNVESFRRAMEISGYSENSGILFCVGTFAEMLGEDGTGEDVIGAIREFGSRKLIHQVHFRNIDRNLPDFDETFPDNGYLNMPLVLKALDDVGFDGMVVPDHVPDTSWIENGGKAAEAFALGYIRGLMQSVASLR